MMETGRSESRTSNQLDPTTQQIQQIRAREMQNLIDATGGSAALAIPRLDLARPSSLETDFYNRAIGSIMGFEPFKLDTGPYQNLASLASNATSRAGAPTTNVFDLSAVNQLRGMGDVDARVAEAMRVSQPGLVELRALTDPTAGLNAAQDYLRRVVAPDLTNTLTAAGLGRSGAIGEAIANAGAQLALPVWESTRAAGRDLASAMLNIPGTALGRAIDAQGALANLFANLGQQTEARETGRYALAGDLAQSGAQLAPLMEQLRLGSMGQYVNLLDTAAQIAARPRLATYEEQVLRPQNLLMTLLTGIPVVQTPVAQRTSGSQSENIGLSLLQAAASGAMGLLMACWIAEAIYGRHSREAMLARYWIGFAWQGAVATVTRGLYRVVGRPVAAVVRRSKTLQRLLRPLFNVAVRRAEGALAWR